MEVNREMKKIENEERRDKKEKGGQKRVVVMLALIKWVPHFYKYLQKRVVVMFIHQVQTTIFTFQTYLHTFQHTFSPTRIS